MITFIAPLAFVALSTVGSGEAYGVCRTPPQHYVSGIGVTSEVVSGETIYTIQFPEILDGQKPDQFQLEIETSSGVFVTSEIMTSRVELDKQKPLVAFVHVKNDNDGLRMKVRAIYGTVCRSIIETDILKRKPTKQAGRPANN